MATTYAEYTQQAQEQTLKLIRESQDAVVEGVKTWATAFEKAVPTVPALPFAEAFPTPQEIVQTSFGFAEQLLKVQREFVDSVLAAAAPVLERTAADKN